jgi:hypothetical protein
MSETIDTAAIRRLHGPVPLSPAPLLRGDVLALCDEVDRLHALLAEHAADALEDVQHWSGYASEYFQQKWNLDDDIAKWERRRDLNAKHSANR